MSKQYGNRYRVAQAESGQKGLEIIKQLKLSDGAIALFLADQRMPQMTGVEFLEKTVQSAVYNILVNSKSESLML